MQPNKDIEEFIQGIDTLDHAKPEKILELLSLLKREKENQLTKSYDETDLEQLQSSYESFLQGYPFDKGQLVKWKNRLKNKRFPEENQPAIVVEVLSAPLYSEKDSGTPYFREPLDIALGMIGREGDFLVFYYDKRRFEPYHK